MKFFSKQSVFVACGTLLGAALIYAAWPALEPMPDDRPLRMNFPDSVDGVGTLRLLAYAKKASSREAVPSDEQIAVVSYIKERISAGAYGTHPELELLTDDCSPGELIYETTAMFLARLIPWDAVAARKIVDLPENRELRAIFEEEEDFRENVARLREDPFAFPIFDCRELVTLARLKIRLELDAGNLATARKYFTKLHALLRFRAREADSLLTISLATAWRFMLENEIAEFFLGKNQPDAETVNSLKTCLTAAGEEFPDFHEVLRRELDWGVASFDYLLRGGNGLWWSAGVNDTWERFLLRGLKKVWLKECLPLLSDIEAQLPLEAIAQKCEKRQKDPYRRFRAYLNVYALFDCFEECGMCNVFSLSKSLLSVRTHTRNGISRARILLACYEYRQKNGAFPQTLSALVPEYLECVPAYFPRGNEGEPTESVYAIDPKTLVVFPQGSPAGGALDEEGNPKEECAFRLLEN